MNRGFLVAVGVVVAGTIGAGIFALPLLFVQAGWLVGAFYLIALSAALIFVHNLYAEALLKLHERKRLVGLVKSLFGKWALVVAVLAIVGGLSLGLTSHFVLGGAFLRTLFPGLGAWAPILFWLLASLPLLLDVRKLSFIEAAGTLGLFATIVVLFVTAHDPTKLFSLAPARAPYLFLPFGPLLFALAGWTAVEPVLQIRDKRDGFSPKRALIWGGLIAAALYALFVFGVVGSDGVLSSDVISGALTWAPWKRILLSLVGLVGLLNVYRLVVLEVKNALSTDLKVPRSLAFAFVLVLPVVLFFLGLNDFGRIIGFSGGVFLAIEYILIILVSKKTLALQGAKNFFANFVMFLFALGAVYELYHFIVR